jgi:hypothetical protein
VKIPTLEDEGKCWAIIHTFSHDRHCWRLPRSTRGEHCCKQHSYLEEAAAALDLEQQLKAAYGDTK